MLLSFLSLLPRRLTIFALMVGGWITPTSAVAGWSWNIGYHNPPTSTFGLNFMYEWSKVAVELGVGSIDSKKTDSSGNTTNTVVVGGDLNLKYLFGSGWFRPYVQGGILLGTAASSGGASAGTGSGFLGAGMMLKGGQFYVYLGANMIGSSTDVNAGVGF